MQAATCSDFTFVLAKRMLGPDAKGDLSMKLGVFTPVFVKLTLDQVVAKARSLPGVTAIEVATGGWPGKDHVDVANSLTRLGSLYRSMGQYAKAEALLRRGLRIREAKLAKEDT